MTTPTSNTTNVGIAYKCPHLHLLSAPAHSTPLPTINLDNDDDITFGRQVDGQPAGTARSIYLLQYQPHSARYRE